MPKAKSTTIGRYFTDINTKEASKNIRKYLIQNVNIPRDNNGNAIRPDEEFKGLNKEQVNTLKENIGQEEYDYIMSDPEKVISDIEKMDIFTYEKAYSITELSNYLKTINPDYKPLPVQEQVKREDFSKKLIEKHNKYAIERSLAINAVNSKWPTLDRTYQTLMVPHFDKYSMLTNETRKNTILSGTPEEKQGMYMEIFNDLASIDLTKIDIMDDQSLLDNFETVADIMSISVELTAILRDAEEAGLDLRGEKYKPLIEQLAAVKEYGYTARLRVDVLSHPLYSQVDISQIEDKFFGNSLTKADGTEVSISDDFQEAFEPEDIGSLSGYATFFDQIGMTQFQKKDNPALDTKLPVEERISKFKEQFWTSGNEFMPKEPKIKKVNGEWIAKDDNGYDDFVEESELGDIDSEKANEELEDIANEMEVPLFDEIIDEEEVIEEKIETIEGESKEINKDDEKPEFNIKDEGINTGVLIDGLPNINQFRTKQEPIEEGPLTQHDALKNMFKDNVRLIQRVIPNFSITDEEIESYITDERIKMHDWAVDYEKKHKDFDKNTDKKLPYMYGRSAFAMVDNSGTPEAEEYNDKFYKLIGEASKQGEQFRTELFAKYATLAKNLDESQFDYKKGFNSMANYVMNNVAAIEVGMELQNINQRRVNDMGIIASEEETKNIKNIEDKGVVLGGVGRSIRETMTSEFFLTFPFDKLSAEQIVMLMEHGNQIKGIDNNFMTKTDQLLKMASYRVFENTRDEYKEPETHDITPEMFTPQTPKLSEMKNKFEKMYNSLKKADNWYNFMNSDKYDNLLKSLDTAVKTLNSIDKNIDKKEIDSLLSAFNNVKKDAQEYVSHVGEQAKNSTQKERLNVAKEALELSNNATRTRFVFDTMIDEYNEDIAKEFYNEIKDDSGYVSNKDDNAELDNGAIQEKMFTKGLQRTEKLRDYVQTLEGKAQPNAEEKYMLEVNKKILGARDELTDLVGRSEINTERIKPYLATILVGTNRKDSFRNDPNGIEKMNKLIETVSKSTAFSKLTENS